MKTITVLQVIIVLLLISGCSTPSTTTMPPKSETGVNIRGVSVTNAVITRSNNRAFYYRKKCKSCGFVSPQTIGSGLPKRPFTCYSNFICPKCKTISKVIIKRTINIKTRRRIKK
jgi:predicted RNA-binding Zn-ribbon protein involved in translation (DUF1610 family)